MIIRIINVIAMFIILVIGLIIFMLTPTGLHLAARVATHVVPGKLRYHRINGLITGPINIDQLYYHHNNATITIQHFHLQWNLLQTIFDGKLHINALIVQHIHYSVQNDWKSHAHQALQSHDIFALLTHFDYANFRQQLLDQKTQWQQHLQHWQAPLTITLKRAVITDLLIKENHRTTLHMKRLIISGKTRGKKIALHAKTTITAPISLTLRANLQGSASQYQLKTTIKHKQFNATLHAIANLQTLKIDITRAHLFSGTATGIIQLYFDHNIRWSTNIHSQQLALRHIIHSHVPKSLSLSIRSLGELTPIQPTIQFHTQVHSPNANVVLAVHHQQQWQVSWNIAVTQLKKLYHTLSGTIHSKGKIVGNLQKATIMGQLNVTQLRLPTISVNTLNAAWHVDSSDHQPSHIKLQAKQLHINQTAISSIALLGNGRLTQHQLSLMVITPQQHLTLKLTGGMQNGWQSKRWQGQIAQFSLVTTQFNQWNMPKTTPLSISENHISLGKFCLHSANAANICSQGNWQRHAPWEFTLQGQLPLSLLTSKTQPSLPFQGNIHIHLQGGKTAKHQAYAHWRIALSPQLALKTTPEVRHLPKNIIQAITVQGQYTQTQLKSDLQIQFIKNNFLRATITLPKHEHLFQWAPDEPIKGTIIANISNLDVVSPLLPKILTLSGQLDANVNIDGNIHQPRIIGHVKLANGKIQFPELNTALSNVSIALNSTENRIHYQIHAQANGQPLTIQGNTDLQAPKKPTTFTINAQRILAVNNDDLLLYVSPNLTLKYVNQQATITGKIEVPEAIIKPKDILNVAALPDADIVYVGKKIPKKSALIKLNIAVNVKLGDKITINTQGATGKLHGEVLVTQIPGQTMLATGKIGIKNGAFDAYGQKLKIASNSLVQYAKSPIDNPSLNVKAYRKINVVGAGVQQIAQNQYVVGVNVGGNIKEPKISLYSIPSNLSQADILSYLVLGKSSSGFHSQDNLSLLVRATSLLNLKSGKHAKNIVDEIRQGLGLSEFGVETQTTVDAVGTAINRQTSFVIGKNITKRLSIRYQQGISTTGISNFNNFIIRYLLSHNWMIQSNTNLNGNDNGADIFYMINK